MSRAAPALVTAFVKVCELAIALGVANINKLPGCWEHQIDDHWWVAVNGHREETVCSRDTGVPSYSAYVEWNGWPAGVFDPINGGAIAHGAVANEDTFIAAVEAATMRATL